MSDLIAFITARLDDDAATARAVSTTFDLFDGTGVIVMQAATGTRSVTLPSHVARFVARHDPARVLREVQAMRAIVEECKSTMEWTEELRQDGQPSEAYARHAGSLLGVLKTLATVWADHSDYRTEWSVTS